MRRGKVKRAYKRKELTDPSERAEKERETKREKFLNINGRVEESGTLWPKTMEFLRFRYAPEQFKEN